jgi:pyridoxal phosphate enzyme (YggS family)
MTGIAGKISALRHEIPPTVKLIAVSKTRSHAEIMEAYSAGQKAFGENRVQELMAKKDSLPADIEWHLIGHLQTNKVKYIVPFVSMIHSVDSFKLLRVINTEASLASRVIKCLLQVHIASEETKFGFSIEELNDMMSKGEVSEMKNVELCGVMGMATYTTDMALVRKEFSFLAACFRDLKSRYRADADEFREISMGMSDDYRIAVEEGSTMIRIGSRIFGERRK